MRSTKGIKIKFSLVLIIALVFCFALVFAFTLYETANYSKITTNNIADARAKDYGDGKIQDVSSAFSSSAFNFLNDITVPSWEVVLNFSDISWSTDQIYGMYQDEADSGLSDYAISYSVSRSGGTFTCTSGQTIKEILGGCVVSDYTWYMVFGFNIGTYITSLLNDTYAGKYQVVIDLDASVSCDETYMTKSSAMALSSSTTLDPNSSDTTGMNFNSVTSTTLTSTTSNQYLRYAAKVSVDASKGVGKNPVITVALHTLTIRIEQTRNIKDGGNPIVTSSLSGLETANGNIANPYITNVSNYFNYNTLLESYLLKDNYSNGSGELSSYVSSPIKNNNNPNINATDSYDHNYYKYLKIEYVDTYNKVDATSIETYLKNINLGKYREDEMTSAQYYDAVNAIKNRLSNSLGAGNKCLSTNYSNYYTDLTTDGKSLAADHSNYAGTTVKYNSLDWGDNPNANNDCAGIKAVQIADTKFWLNLDSDKSITQQIIVGGVLIGSAKVYIQDTNNYYSKATIELYFYCNTEEFAITVADYGVGNCESTIKVSGIDTESPTHTPTLSSDDKVISVSESKLNWARMSTLTAKAESNVTSAETQSASYSPYVWFYDVVKNASAFQFEEATTYSSYADILAAGLEPIAVSEFEEFKYDFVSGYAINSLGKQVGDFKDIKGSGYYRFVFYTCDVAGNCSTTKIPYFVKVDYETPYSTTTVKAGTTTIDDSNNGLWSQDTVSISIKINKDNISGNTLTFSTYDYDCSLVVENSKIVRFIIGSVTYTPSQSEYDEIIKNDGLAVKITYADGKQDMIEDLIEITGSPNMKSYLNIKVSEDGEGTVIKLTIPIKSGEQKLFAWEAFFTMYVGQDIEGDMNTSDNIEVVGFDATQYTVASVKFPGINFSKDLKVYIDNTAPVIPTISDEGLYLINTNESNLPSSSITNRKWYTHSDMLMSSALYFTDSIIDSDFASGLKVFYGVRAIENGDFSKITNFLKAYETIDFSTNAFTSYFNRTAVYTGDVLDDGETAIELDLMQNIAGLRIVAVWAVDQAGLKSDSVQLYYVLCDPTEYSIKSGLYANALLGAETAKISVTNSDEVSSAKFVRGETITMTFSLEEGYVPYLLEAQCENNPLILLQNYTTNIDWKVLTAYSGLVSIDKSAVADNIIIVNYVLDNPATFNGLDKNIYLEFSHRKVVNYSLTNTSVRYTGKDAIVPLVYSDDKQVDVCQFKFKAEKASVWTDTAKNPGEYSLEVYIPYDNHSFVSAEIKFNENTLSYVDILSTASMTTSEKTKLASYEQKVIYDFTILPGIAIIKANSSTSYYGQSFTSSSLSYIVEGTDADSTTYLNELKGLGKITGSLKLNTDKEYNTLEVGSYAIVQKQEFKIEYDGFKFYNVTFEGNFHKVEPKVINIDILDGSKTYGTTDGEYKFTINCSDNGINALKLESILGFRYNSYDPSTQIATYLTNQYITREPGENAGEYNYISSANLFSLKDINYVINIASSGKYTIEKLKVKIDASGQSQYILDTEGNDLGAVQTYVSSIIPTYSLGAYSQYQEQIELKLIVDSSNYKTPVAGEAGDNYSIKYDFKIGIDTTNTVIAGNFIFELLGDPYYTIYVAKNGVVTISLKDDVRIELTYGQDFNPTIADYNDTDFIIKGAEGLNITSINWTATNSSLMSSGTYPNVGAYMINVEDIELYDEAEKINNVTVVVSPFPVYVVPATIVIAPYAANDTKTYSSSDETYKITHEVLYVKDIKGNKYYDDYALATLDEISGYVSGKFARAIYHSDGTFAAFGSNNDDVSDDNGVMLGSTDYYSFAVLNEYTTAGKNSNYIVEVVIDTDERLSISPAKIEVTRNNFVGISRVYDSTSIVKYGTNDVAVDISSKLKVATDDVYVIFDANYVSKTDGTPSASVGIKDIEFYNLALAGVDAQNYELWYKEDGQSSLVTDSVTITISTITNDSSESIRIYAGIINLIRDDFDISKEFDNQISLSEKNITIKNRSDTVGNTQSGSSVLYAARDNMQRLYGEFSGKEVGSYTIDLTLFFPLDLEEIDSNNLKINQEDKTITVEAVTVNNVLGVRVIITGINAEITKRVITADDFKSITPVNRDYNSTSIVSFNYELKDGVAADGDEDFAKGSYINITGETKDQQSDVGTYQVTFTKYNISNALYNSRYSVDIVSLNSKYSSSNSKEVVIDYAKLMPKVTYVAKKYSGSSSDPDDNIVAVIYGTAPDALTTLNFSEELRKELMCFTYDHTLVKYYYSRNGEIDGNVQVDANGNVLLHNVLVSGMVITEGEHLEKIAAYNSEITAYYDKDGVQLTSIVDATTFEAAAQDVYVKKVGYLKNYRVYGSKYVDGEPLDLGAIVSGDTIPSYEAASVAELNQLELSVVGNDIAVSNKVYDGTKDAVVSISLESSNAIPADKQYLAVEATATYAKKQVGTNINVTIKVNRLVLVDSNDTDHKALLTNYKLSPFTTNDQRDILQRPVEIDVSFKERTYSGKNDISKDLIEYSFKNIENDKLLKAEANDYIFSTEGGAYYVSKDVNIVDSQIVNQKGTAYNIVLYNSKEKYINYVLSTKSSVPVENKAYFAYELADGTILYVSDGNDCMIKATTFASGQTYYTATYEQIVNPSESNFNDNLGLWYYYDSTKVVGFYYTLDNSNKYILVTDFDEIYNKLDEDAKKVDVKNSIVGYYKVSNDEVYILDTNYSSELETKVQTLSKAVSYVQGEGLIKQRSIYISSIEPTPDSDKYSKVYDGTSKFYGKQNLDYTIDASAIRNGKDKISVASVETYFAKSDAGVTQISFIAKDIDVVGGSKENYRSIAASISSVEGQITKRTIYASLGNATMTYGSSIDSVTPTITYSLDKDGNIPVTLKEVGGKTLWFVDYDKFITLCGIDDTTLEAKFVKELNAQRYNASYEKAEDGEYYALAGEFVEPVKDIVIKGSRPTANYIAEKYGLKDGSATNFEFEYIYTKEGKKYTDKTSGKEIEYSKLLVVKKTVYVVVENITYTQTYGTDFNHNNIKLGFLNQDGNNGIVSGETSLNIYTGSISVVFKKVKINNGSIEFVENVSASSEISKDFDENNKGLKDGEYYIAYIESSKDFASSNYEVIFGTIKYEDESKKFVYKFNGFNENKVEEVPQLTIVLPELTGVSLSDTAKEVIYNAQGQAKVLVNGLQEGDEVTIAGIDPTNVKIENDKVVAYNGKVVVTRYLLGGKYFITKDLGEASLTINKASAGLKVAKQTVEYDGKGHKINDRTAYSISDTNIGTSSDNFTVEYYYSNDYKLENPINIDTNPIINAGTYIFKVTLTPSGADANNYSKEEKTGEFVISPATINVVIENPSKLVQQYFVGRSYSIDYSIEDVKGIGIAKDDTIYTFYKNGEATTINKYGRYSYVISLNEEKYNELGNNVVFVNNTGFFDLTVHEIDSYNTEDTKVATLELKNAEDKILVDSYEVKYLSQNNNIAEDDLYWASVNQYMATISDQIGAGATLASVVRMSLLYGTTSQSLNGKDAIISVSLPENVEQSLNGYAVYATNSNGGLVLLRNGVDYQLENGVMTYTTNYLGSLVFVKLGDEGLSTPVKVGIGVGASLLVLLIAAAVATTLIKKKKLKAMA